MGFILTLILVGAFLIYLTYYCYSNETKPDDIVYRPTAVKNAILGIVPCILLIIAGGISGSFEGHCVLKEKLATTNQYKVALNLYTKHANIPTGAADKIISDLTDKKYEDYQLLLSRHVTDYRKAVVEYNKLLTNRVIWNNSWYFGWIIVDPDDDMRLIKMEI